MSCAFRGFDEREREKKISLSGEQILMAVVVQHLIFIWNPGNVKQIRKKVKKTFEIRNKCKATFETRKKVKYIWNPQFISQKYHVFLTKISSDI